MIRKPIIDWRKDMTDKKPQLDRFKEAARELGTDDDEVRFNEKLKKLAKQKPKDDKVSDS